MEPSVTTEDLLARWREAEEILHGLERNSPAWGVGRWIADQAWNDYAFRLDEERAARGPDGS
jgi:hypothetical protein